MLNGRMQLINQRHLIGLRSGKKLSARTFELVGEALVSFWFWFPVSYALYLFVQLYFLVAYGIVSIIPVPFVTIVYALILEEKRIKKAVHGVDKKFVESPSKLIEEYLETIKKD
jgi:hypothetical protein